MTNLTRRAFGTFAFAATGAALVASSAHADGHSKNHRVTISNFTFSPKNITINKGDTITFVNTDGAPHTATDKGGSFDTGRLGQGAKGDVVFAAAGTFNYFCAIHPMMKGSITVKG